MGPAVPLPLNVGDYGRVLLVVLSQPATISKLWLALTTLSRARHTSPASRGQPKQAAEAREQLGLLYLDRHTT